MDTKELGKKLKGFLNHSAEISKDAFEKAGDKVQNFTDKSVLKIEKKQLENKRDDKYKELGIILSNLLSISAEIPFASEKDKEKAKALELDIQELSKQIEEKENNLNF